MSIEVALRTLLINDEAINAVVGDRVYPITLPQAPTLPAITYQIVSNINTYSLDGDSGLDRPRVQIDTWAPYYDDAKSLARLIRTKLSGFRGYVGGVIIAGAFRDSETDMYEPGFENLPQLYRTSQDFFVWHNV